MTIAPSSLLSTAPVASLAIPDLTTPPSDFDPTVFDGMPLNFKMAYLARYGTGTPKEVTMGADVQTQRVFREVMGLSSVTGVAIRPEGYHRAPGDLTFAVFSSWPERDKLDYMNRKATAGAITLSGGERIRLAVNGKSLFREPAGFATLPANLRQSEFETWPYEARLSYVARQASPDVAQTGRPGVMLHYTDTGDSPIYYLKGSSASDYVLMKRPERFKIQWVPGPSMDQFRSAGWTDDDRMTYMRIHGTTAGPYTLLTLDPTVETAILDNGRFFYAPAAFALQNGAVNVTTDLFESWSPTLQMAYIEKNKVSGGFLGLPGYVKIPVSNSPTNESRLYYIETRSGGRDVRTRPASFDKAPSELTLQTFSSGASGSLLQNGSTTEIWSDRDRIDYILLKGNVGVVTIGNATITTDFATGSKVYYLTSMTKADFAKMSGDDQNRVLALANQEIQTSSGGITTTAKRYPALYDHLKTLGLLSNVTAAQSLITTAKTELATIVSNLRQSAFDTSSEATNGGKWTVDTQKQVFEAQFAILEAQISAGGLFDEQAIADKISRIQNSIKRWSAFYPVLTEDYYKGWPTNVQSATSDNKAFAQARIRLIEQENLILKNMQERQNIATSNMFGGKQLDGPTIVFLFQQRYEKQVSAQTAADTEELNQINDLLKTYAAFQQVINKTLGQFDSGNSNEKKQIDITQITDNTQRRAITMFSLYMGTQPRPGPRPEAWFHPIETLHLNGSRERWSIIADKSDTEVGGALPQPQNFWSNISSSLNSTVTTLNQVAQTKMNDINSVDKQKNRHFDLANGALSKLSEMLQTLGRNIA